MQIFNLQKQPRLKVSVILALIIIFSFSNLIILNQSYHSIFPFPNSFYDIETTSQFSTIDPGADFWQVWPQLKLTTELLKEGIFPFWNPYIGLGNPLAADTTSYNLSPIIFGFFIPMPFWDLVLLIMIWASGFFMFLFLQSLSLKNNAAILGAALYMLSGSFVWYLPHTHIAVMMFTPLILFSIEKFNLTRKPKFLILLSGSVFLGILGAHVESIILQTIIVLAYIVYRPLSEYLLNLKVRSFPQSKIFTSKIFFISLVFFLGGLSLSSLYVLPVYELLNASSLPHETTAGLVSHNPIATATAFFPYSMGPLHYYWSDDVKQLNIWPTVWGYVGMASLFFTVISVIYCLKNRKENSIHQFTPIFFLIVSVFFILKTIGTPIVNSLGELPILEQVIFTRYSGVIIPLGFSVCAAFGIHYLQTKNNDKLTFFSFLSSLVIVFALFLPLFSYVNPNNSLSIDDVNLYLLAQLFFGISIILILWIIIKIKSKFSLWLVSSIIFLELSMYIPLSLDPNWHAIRSFLIVTAMSSIVFFSFLASKTKLKLIHPIYFLSIVFILIIIGSTIVITESSSELPKRFDSYKDNPITEFLNDNLGHYRIFSFDQTIRANHASALQLYSLNIMTPFVTKDMSNFITNFLDSDSVNSNLSNPVWTFKYGVEKSTQKFLENKKYFDFLGVKYILTHFVIDEKLQSELNLKKSFQFKEVFLYENMDTFPRAYLLDDIKIVQENTSQEFLLSNKQLDLHNTVILESQNASEKLIESNDEFIGNAIISDYSPNTVYITTNSNFPSVLVLTDMYYPGWKATVDDIEVDIYKANGIVRAIYVPEGTHYVKFEYFPESYFYGGIISLLTLLALITFFIINKTPKPNPDFS